MANHEAQGGGSSKRVPLIKVANATTTPAGDTNPKTIKVDKKALRRAQNEELLKNANVRAVNQRAILTTCQR